MKRDEIPVLMCAAVELDLWLLDNPDYSADDRELITEAFFKWLKSEEVRTRGGK